MSRSRQKDLEEVCAKCELIRNAQQLRPSKNDEGEKILVCKDSRTCGKQERIVIKALVRRSVRTSDNVLLGNRRLQWVFEEIGQDQIKMSGPLIPPNPPTLRDIKLLIDERRKFQYSEEGNHISVVCLDFERYTTTNSVAAEETEEEEQKVVNL